MGLFDRARKLAEQAKEKAEGALSQATSRAGSRAESPASATPPVVYGTAYRPGMLGRPGWREKGRADPAALLPVADRDRAGVPHETRSEIVEEPYGMGRRWSSGDRSAGLFHPLYPEHQAWSTPWGGDVDALLDNGRTVTFVGTGDRRVVLETAGLDESARADLARAVTAQLAAG